LGDIWGFKEDGLFQTAQEVNSYLSKKDLSYFGTGWSPGDVKYLDLNGDGSVNIGENTLSNPGDRVVIGNSRPHYNYSFRFGLEWKNVRFSMFWQGVGKRQIWPGSGNSRFWGWNRRAHTIVQKASLDFWTEDNPDAYLPRPYAESGGAGFSKDRYNTARYLLHGAYARLKSLQIGYTLPSSLTDELHLNKLEIYANGVNLLTISKMWQGIDPETAGATRSYSYGNTLSNGLYPLSRSFGVGVNIIF
jgi:hypothetical protein